MRTNKRGLTQAYDLRDFSYDACIAFRETLRKADGKLALTRDDCMSVVSLVKAWEGAVDAIRVLRGKPLPGSLRPERKPSKKRTVSLAPTEEPINPSRSGGTAQ